MDIAFRQAEKCNFPFLLAAAFDLRGSSDNIRGLRMPWDRLKGPLGV